MTATFSDAAELRNWLVDYLVTNIGCNPDEIDLDVSLTDLGVGSRDAVVLSGELAELLGRPVSPVDFWQHPTINALIGFLTAPESEPAADDAVVGADRGPFDEPIAVIGLGCRFPRGVSGPEVLWQFLRDGGSSVGEVPADRWAPFDDGSPEVAAALAGTTRWGSFLSDIDGFDAELFDISLREAAKMDPQQRLLLEVAWEALEHAGIPPSSLRRSQTGVFAGACLSEYGYFASSDLGQVDGWSNTGGAVSIIPNRLSYFLDLRGPSVAVDTACSSSLVAVHLACQSLRMRDSDLAIAAGVNLLLSPAVFRGFDEAGALSATGQCHAFDAAADGFVRGEGCGVVVLKRLIDAMRDGDRLLAVVRGSAVNQDGRSNGLMAPNPAAQIAVLRAAYANAGIPPHEVDYVEAHGTGTLLGDPIEARALGTVLGRGRPESSPLLIGAIKSNIGHLEAAAGVAGFIKAVLAVQHGHIPANLGFQAPNPHIQFPELRLKVVTDHQDWPSVRHPRRAGVSSFGFGGTNAHVVIEQAPDVVAVEAESAPVVSTLVVSGKTPERIASMAGVLAEWMSGPGAGVGLADVAHTLNHHRARHARFATVCARDRAQAVTGLKALATGRPAPGVVGAHEGPCGPGTVFLYSGQGSQWAGMARQLLADEPAFAAAIAELEPAFVAEVGFSLRQILAGTRPAAAEGTADASERSQALSRRAAARAAARAGLRAVHAAELRGDARVQPVLMGLQLGLTALWRSYGVQPDAVIGHSMGEVAAAVVAGALTVTEGLRVIATRSRLMGRLAGLGAVALVELDAEATAALIADYPQVTLAVYASPRQTVIAGPPEQIDALITVVQQRDRFAHRVNMEVASHNPIMDPILPELRAGLADLTPMAPRIPFLTTVYDNPGVTPVFDADYWAANVRNPVRLSQAVSAAGHDHTTFIEISPHPMLTHAIDETLAGAHHHSIGTLRRDDHDTHTFHTNLNAAHTTHPPRTPHPPEPHPVLPNTPWHHTRHWISPSSAAPLSDKAHPLLGNGVTDPATGRRVWQNRLGPDLLWLGDHRIDEECILPGAAYAEIALAAVRDAWGEIDLHSWTIRELLLHHLMVVTDETEVVTTLAGDKSQARVEIRSRRGDSEWVINAVANVGCVSSPVDRAALDMDGAPLAEVGPDDLYGRLRGVGLQYGPAFQGVVGLALCDSGVARARVRLPSAARRDSRRFLLHPVMVDIALQVLGATKGATDLFAGNVEGHALVLPVRFGGVRVFGDVTKAAYAVGSLQPIERSGREVGRVVVTDADGQALLAIDEVEMEVLPASGHADELTRRMFVLEWVPSDLGKAVPDIGGGVLVVAEAPESDELLNAVTSSLAGRTESLQYVSPTDERELHAALTRSDISWDEILVVLPTGADDESQPDQRQLDDVQKRTLLIAEIVKTVSKVGSRNSPRLLIVTRGAQQLDSADPVTLAQTGVRGLARVLTFEHPELKATIVDVDPAGAASADALVAEVLADADADEVALRDGQRYVHRLVAAPTTPTGQVAAEVRYTDVDVDVDGPAGFRLQLDHAGRLDGLSVHAIPRRAPQPGEVEVRVNVAALNFSDVLKTMGLYPGLNGQAPVIGGEGVGVVTAVGEGVDSVRTGQRVLIVGPGTFGSHVTTMEDLVVPIPDALSDHEAATFGVAYLTAWYSLREVGRLAAGERVLIHSATGGVGLAAIAVAKMVGARIYATAGSDSKRRLLTTLGVDYVGDSRNVAFAEEILELTNRAGVDVVLNSLAGEAINRGVEILAPGGRFVELGKKDVYADAQLGLAALAKSASFSVVDLDLNLRLQPQRYRRMLCDILTLAADRELNPLPRTEFTFDRVIDAFRLMASGGHTGKILVSMPTEGTVRAVAAPPQPPVARDGGYIVVGGMGGVGFVAARWLAEQGAGIVVLNGRSAPDTDTARAIADLNANGKRVEVLVGDIAAEETAGRLVAAVENAGFRVRGVLHSAMVLDDQIVLNMSESAVARVLRAKVTGSWRLHEATAHKDLDWWLAFSSAASLLGSPGQGAYAAANSWLDGFVAYRRSRGLPAVGINWGPWAEVGRAQSFANLGFSMVTPEQGLAAIERLLAADRSSTGVFGIDARQWFQSFPAAAQSSLFAELSDSATFGHRGDGKVAAELAAMAPSERRTRLASTIADAIRAVVRSSEPIDHHDAMNSLGLDSLMTLELRNRLESSVGITLPATLVWSHPTISDLADTLCERLGYEPECGDGVRDRAHQRAAARQGAALRRKRGQHL